MSEAESVNVPQRTELFHVVDDAVGPMERCGDERGAASATWVESVSIDIASGDWSRYMHAYVQRDFSTLNAMSKVVCYIDRAVSLSAGALESK